MKILRNLRDILFAIDVGQAASVGDALVHLQNYHHHFCSGTLEIQLLTNAVKWAIVMNLKYSAIILLIVTECHTYRLRVVHVQ